jgi:Protein of unknown function (DUF2585)
VVACDHLCLWSGHTWSSDNSQQLFGSFTFTHVLHGFLLCGLLALILPRLAALGGGLGRSPLGDSRELGVHHPTLP